MRALTIKDNVVDNMAIFNDDAELPDGWIAAPADVGIGWIDKGAGEFSHPENKQMEQLSSEEKRHIAINQLVYDFGDGRVIQTRPKDYVFIQSAIAHMERKGINSKQWVMADNKKQAVSLKELKLALEMADESMAELFDDHARS